MAFTSKAERTEDFGLAQKVSVEPILAHREYQVRQAVAPFNTSAERNEASNKQFLPGPGLYNTTETDQTKTLMQAIMQRLKNAKAPFNSQVDRFESNNRSATRLLGPGQYYPEVSVGKTPRNMILQKRSKSQMKEKPPSLLPHHTPPSIPSGDFRFGYKVDENTRNVVSLKSLF